MRSQTDFRSRKSRPFYISYHLIKCHQMYIVNISIVVTSTAEIDTPNPMVIISYIIIDLSEDFFIGTYTLSQ